MDFNNLKANLFLNPSSRWYYPAHWLVLIVLGLAIYGQTFGYSFVFDDWTFIVNNDNIRRFDHVHYIWQAFPKTRTIGFYSFVFNYFINGLHPRGYHVFNFVVHLLAAGLVWACATKLFKITGTGPQECPFIIALLFLVHPCQTQAVSYISQRFESMATVFYLGSIYSYLCARTASSTKYQAVLFISCGACAVLGIMTKEVAVTIPLMILAIEWILFRSKRYLLTVILGFLFVLLFMKMVRTNFIDIYFHFSAVSGSHQGDIITGGKYLLTQMRVFLTFLRLLILPINQNVDYDYPLSTSLLNPPLTLAGLCMIGWMAFLTVRLRKQWPLTAFGLAWVLITFSINTAPRANVIFEHKLYLISFGFILAAVCALASLIKDRRILYGLLIAFIAILSVTTYERNHVWRSDLTLWEDAVGKSPHKARPIDNRGVVYYQSGNLREAMADFNRAIAIDHGYGEAYYNRGNLYDKLGNFSLAIADYSNAIAINPGYADAYNNRGNIYRREGDLKLALADFNKALESNPQNAGIQYNHSLVVEAYLKKGLSWMQQRKVQEALADIQEALAIEPGNYDALIDLSGVYFCMGRYESAIKSLNQAQLINPTDYKLYTDRANCYLAMGRKKEAQEDMAISLRLK